jgi:hypothetical protein
MPFSGDILTSVLRKKYVNAIRLLDQLVTVMEREAHFPSATRETFLSWVSLIIE